MLVGALLLPLLIGVGALVLLHPRDRPKGLSIVPGLLRGYPFSLLLAITLVFLAGVALVRKARALARRWDNAHVPIVVWPGHYDGLVAHLRDTMARAGIDVETSVAPRALTVPAQLLARVAGPGVAELVPDRLALLAQPGEVEVLVYPSDVAISGRKRAVARSRAAIASGLTGAPAYLTTTQEAQEVEDQIRAVADEVRRRADGEFDGTPNARGSIQERLGRVDQRLSTLTVPYDEWEVLYRMRLQVDRDLLATPVQGVSVPDLSATAHPGSERPRVQLVVAMVGMLIALADVVLALLERFAPRRAR
jgi:hypothetical protein